MLYIVGFPTMVFLLLHRHVSSDTTRIGPWPTSLGEVDYQAIFGGKSKFFTDANRALTTGGDVKSVSYTFLQRSRGTQPLIQSASTVASVTEATVNAVGSSAVALASNRNAQNVPSYSGLSYSAGTPTLNYYPPPVPQQTTTLPPLSTDSSNLPATTVSKMMGYTPGVLLTTALKHKELVEMGDSVDPNTNRPQLQSSSLPPSQFPATLPIAEIKAGASILGNFTKQTVVADSSLCSEMGNSILTRGGNAVDAAITTLLCTGVVHPHDSGLGGSVLLNIYMRDSGKAVTISGLSSAPRASSENMFQWYPSGWNSIATPGFLAGIREAHRQFGSVEWANLFQPVISLARNGFMVDEDLASNIQKHRVTILADPGLRNTFMKDAGADSFFAERNLLKLPKLAEVLEAIANDPCFTCEFYKLSIAKALLFDVTLGGGILSRKDMFSYRASVQLSTRTNLTNGLVLLTPPLPSAGPILNYLMLILDGATSPKEFDLNMASHYHLRMEAEGFGFALFNEMGDPKFTPKMQECAPSTLHSIQSPEDLVTFQYIDSLNSRWFADRTRNRIKNDSSYTDTRSYGIPTTQTELDAPETDIRKSGSAVTILDAFGNAVAAYSGLGDTFGSGKMSPLTGIILNNEMSDFEFNSAGSAFLPINQANKIVPGKRPIKWVSPVIALDKDDDVQFAVSSANGKRSLSGLFQVVYHLYHAGYDIKMAIDQKSVHRNLNPLSVEYEAGFPMELAAVLAGMGHHMTVQKSSAFSMQGIQVDKEFGFILSLVSSRKLDGSVAAGV